MILRFAPSPTGLLHVGNVRVAIINYIEALKHDGQLILRFENSDPKRSTIEYENQILDDLTWLNIKFDHIYRQLDRMDIYKAIASELLKSGSAYRCFCSKDKLQDAKRDAINKGIAYRYSGCCSNIADKESKRRAETEPYTIRLKNASKIVVKDVIRGDIEFDPKDIDDFIILREDGTATYNFACSVDDIDMKIDEVIRGEDHITNTARQIAVLNALNKKLPNYIHLPTMLDVGRKKISKRKGGFSIKDLRKNGILPEAIILYLASLGSGKNFNYENLILQFSIKKISKSNIVFDYNKLLRINETLIKTISEKKLMKHLKEFDDRAFSENWMNFVAVFRKNAETLKELDSLIDRFLKFVPEKAEYADKDVLTSFVKAYKENDFSYSIRKTSEQTLKKGKELYHPIRMALTGDQSGPPLLELIEVFGKQKSLARLESAI